eukprot:166401-Chlamydomonas_euryale.AAC.2
MRAVPCVVSHAAHAALTVVPGGAYDTQSHSHSCCSPVAHAQWCMPPCMLPPCALPLLSTMHDLRHMLCMWSCMLSTHVLGCPPTKRCFDPNFSRGNSTDPLSPRCTLLPC